MATVGREKRDVSKQANDAKVQSELLSLKMKGKAKSGPGTWSNTRPGTGKQ